MSGADRAGPSGNVSDPPDRFAPTLDAIISAQLDRLMREAALPPGVAAKVGACRRVLTDRALQRPPATRYHGLSQINPDGLPFQWSFCIGVPPGVRFLCEIGPPGAGCADRYRRSITAIGRALEILGMPPPAWLWDVALPIVLPAEDAIPEGWRSALWCAVGASGRGVILKVYASLERDDPELRWRRIGQVLFELGRRRSLERLCDMSSSVSGQSWPVCLAFDVTPDGSPGRIKAYFKAGKVGPSWLARWYDGAGLPDEIAAVRTALEAFPWHPHRPYWPGSLFVSAEFDALENLTLKTDLAVSRWVASDALVVHGVRRLADSLGLDAAGYLRSLGQLDDWPPNAAQTRTHHVVGIGVEENGDRHINVYCEPATRTTAEAYPRPGAQPVP